MINDIKNDLPQNRLVYKNRHICSQPFMRVISRLANVYFIEITILERLTHDLKQCFINYKSI
ncbi:TPA_asm: hypothetical protein GDM61_17770 [Salmonella enterica subsp. enterica serovar Decatur]|uniref:Uncharacterized protein n=2 Tax=Salmonella enterica I TaxID=59201 RepID=A0A6V9XQP1_SALET|nr:hypothetical protein [Salmonella enterica]EBX8089738.1 hypothetical protein [Salmonella enterica subsp. enterica serovar Choleraesuis]EBX8838956.1 hypothetical protein [Salmonella enterica subsp. enterica serovar Urbana]ECK9410790.1 hypothetical protein [Salmonella enterica subsp. enterica serovar Typhisuis str. CFSAN000655]ECK9466236.1 hypothetical protein [Salmonella enterica subsp. enterica serovar Decatur str. CFSAN000563]RJH19275.1 hypothetical protein D5G18_23305 [Salmonella enterica 